MLKIVKKKSCSIPEFPYNLRAMKFLRHLHTHLDMAYADQICNYF